MKIKEPKAKVRERTNFDPVLFAATVPSRKPTAKDIQDTKAHEGDLIEPKEYEDTDELLDTP
ncbi:MAG TPA: hypothetical protein VGN23_02520 [Verrucomicrobiae bacterium]